MNEMQSDRPGSVATAPVFVSYATADRRQALSVCKALERRGTSCWISCRDVPPGENYQEAIVRALRASHAVVLIFSNAANLSGEIKKELSLASRYQKPVIALRIENVEPTDAFAYELSTRQWIDAFAGRDKALDALVRRLRTCPARVRRANFRSNGSDRLRRPRAGPYWAEFWHSSRSRSAPGFGSEPPRLPRTAWSFAWGIFDNCRRTSRRRWPKQSARRSLLLSETMGSSASRPRHLRIRATGPRICWVVPFVATAIRSGLSLASPTSDPARPFGRIVSTMMRHTSNAFRAELLSMPATWFTAACSQLRRTASRCPMLSCRTICNFVRIRGGASNSLTPKRRRRRSKVAAALPDFSFGWSAITTASEQVFYRTEPGAHRNDVQKLGLEAADKALALDPTNSEAFAQKSLLLGSTEWPAREALLKQAIGARPLFCGCERYSWVMLQNVGRFVASVTEMRRSTEMLALDGISQFGLAKALLVTGDAAEANSHFEAAIDLSRQPDTASVVAMGYAPETGNYTAGISALSDKRLDLSPAKRSALLEGVPRDGLKHVGR